MPVRALRRFHSAHRVQWYAERQNPINARKGITTLRLVPRSHGRPLCQNPINARKGITTLLSSRAALLVVAVRQNPINARKGITT